MDSIFSLKNKNVVLTGGCGNLGRIMAKHLLDFGANLFIVDVVDAAPAELGDKVNYIKCDLSNTASIRAMFEQVDAAGGLDVLINNAAWGGGAGGKKMLSVLLFSCFFKYDVID